MPSVYARRIKKVQSELKALGSRPVMILASASRKIRNRDNSYQYRQDSDFFYLTGSTSEGMALFVSPQSIALYAPPADPHRLIWDGADENPKHIAEEIGAELIRSKTIESDLKSKVKTSDFYVFQNYIDSPGWRIAQEVVLTQSGFRAGGPIQYAHTDLILGPMRLKKSRDEISKIKEAIDATRESLEFCLAKTRPGVSEHEIACEFEYRTKLQQCDVAFGTIVAAGPSAAVLHYAPIERELREHQDSRSISRNDMVLFDCGAEFRLYSADITRVIPAADSFSDIQREIYQIVLEAEQAAINRVRAGVKVATVYNAAARVLSRGLKSLGVLSGTVDSIYSKQKYRAYFPHGIGHSLGLDVHDLSNHRGNNNATLEEGMVFTIEPGLYFPKKVGKVPACGVRIEDDILVTANGCQVLSKSIPKEVDEVEEWVGACRG